MHFRFNHSFFVEICRLVWLYLLTAWSFVFYWSTNSWHLLTDLDWCFSSIDRWFVSDTSNRQIPFHLSIDGLSWILVVDISLSSVDWLIPLWFILSFDASSPFQFSMWVFNKMIHQLMILITILGGWENILYGFVGVYVINDF